MVKQLIISNNISFLWLFKIDFFKSQVINFISVHVNRLFNKIKLFGLPTKTSKFRVLRSPHVNKKSMESFYIVRSKYFSNSFNLNGLEVVRKLSDLIEMFMKFLSLTSIKTKSIIFKMWNEYKISLSQFSYCSILLTFNNYSNSKNLYILISSILLIYVCLCYLEKLHQNIKSFFLQLTNLRLSIFWIPYFTDKRLKEEARARMEAAAKLKREKKRALAREKFEKEKREYTERWTELTEEEIREFDPDMRNLNYKVIYTHRENQYDPNLTPEELERRIKSNVVENPIFVPNESVDLSTLKDLNFKFFNEILIRNEERFAALSNFHQQQLLVVLNELYPPADYCYTSSEFDISLQKIKEMEEMDDDTNSFSRGFSSRVLNSFYNEDGVLKDIQLLIHPEFNVLTQKIMWVKGALDYVEVNGSYPWIIQFQESLAEKTATKQARLDKIAEMKANDPNINQWAPDYAAHYKSLYNGFTKLQWLYKRTFHGKLRFNGKDFNFLYNPHYKKRSRESWSDWYRYLWEARDDLEQHDWFPTVPLLDYKIPVNIGELKEQFLNLTNSFLYDLIWEPNYVTITVNEFAKWINENGNVRSAYKEATAKDIEEYLAGFTHYRKMDEVNIFENSYYYKWFPGTNHPFFTRVLSGKKVQWVDGYDLYTNEPVMIRYRGSLEHNDLVEVISYPEYLHLVRSEQDLLREREEITFSVSTYFDQYTYDEFLNNEARKVTWMKEYSSVLHSFEVNTSKTYNPYFDLYFKSDNSIWNEDVMWNDHWEIHGGEHSLHQYLLTFELMLREYWHFDMFTSMFKIFNWFWVAFGIDTLFKMQWWLKWEPMVLYRCWRIEAIGVIRKRTGFFLFYTDKTNVFIFISIYWWFMHHSRNVLQRMRLWEQYVTAGEKQKLSLVARRERERNCFEYVPRTDNPGWLSELPFFGRKNKFKLDWKDRYEWAMKPIKVTHNNTSVAGSLGKVTEAQLYWYYNLPILKNEWLYLISLIKESFQRVFVEGGLVRYFWKVALVEYSILTPMLSFIFSIPNKVWTFSCYSIKAIYNFIWTIPELIRAIPGFLMHVFVAFLQIFVNIKLSIVFIYNKIIEEVINFWPFLLNLLEEWVYLLYETFYIYPIRSFWNFIERTFNLSFYRPLITNWEWYKKWDSYNLEKDFTIHETGINWIRHYQRVRPQEHYTKLDIRNSFYDFLAIFYYHPIKSSSLEEVWGFIFDEKCNDMWARFGVIQKAFEYCKEWGISRYTRRLVVYLCELLSFKELPPNEEWNFYRRVNLYRRHWVNKGRQEDYLITEWKFLHEYYLLYKKQFKKTTLKMYGWHYPLMNLKSRILEFYLQMTYGGFALDWWWNNKIVSFIYYPIVLVWRHTVIRALISIRYAFNLWWEYKYYNGWKNLTSERLWIYFKYWRGNTWQSFWFIFSSFKDSCVYNISFMLGSIFYPLHVLKYYFLEILNNIYEFLWGYVYQYCNIDYIKTPIHDFIYKYLGFYNYALGFNFDLSPENPYKKVEEAPKYDENGSKIIDIVELFDEEKNNKLGNEYEAIGNFIYDYEKLIEHPNPLLPEKPEGWVANKDLALGVAKFYREFSQVNLLEDKFPLTPFERVLDNANALDRGHRNLVILELMKDRDKADIVLVEDIIGRFMYNEIELLEHYSGIWEKDISLWATFNDWVIQYPQINALSSIYTSYAFWADKYIRPVYLFFFEGDGGLITLEFFLCLPARIKYIFKNIPFYYNWIETKLIWLITGFINNINDMFIYSKEFLRLTYGLAEDTFDIQFFIDMFFYWFYIIPYKDWNTRYLNHIFNENWLFTAEYFAKLNNVFVTVPGEKKNNFLELTGIWAYYHQTYWEGKSYFENSSWKSYYELTRLALIDYNLLRIQYVENKFYLSDMKFYKKFDYSRSNIIPWYARYGGNLFFEKEELIEYLGLRFKYSIMFFFKFISDSFIYGVNLISFDISTVIFGVLSAPLSSLSLYNKCKLFLIEYKLGYANVKNQFYFEFTELYIKPSVDTLKDFYTLVKGYILLYYEKLLNILYEWYIVPVKANYDIDLRNIFDFKFYELFIIWNEITVNIAIYHLENTYNMLVFLIKRSWNGLEIIWKYLNEFLIDPLVEYIVVNYIFSLKVKIVIFISNYFQELEGRINSVEGFFKEFFIVKRNIKISMKQIKGFDNTSIIEFICSLSDSIILLFTIIKGLIQTVGAYMYWMVLDIFKYISFFYNILEKLGHFGIEVYLKIKYLYMSGCNSFIVLSSRLFWLNVDLAGALYNFILGLFAEWIIFGSKILNVICVDMFQLEHLGKYVLMVGEMVKETICFFTHVISSILSIFVEYDKTQLRILDVRKFLIRFNMAFIDFYQWVSRGEYWWENIVFARIYWFLIPIKEWIEYNLEYGLSTKAIVLRGDYGRKMPSIVGEHYDHLTDQQDYQLYLAFWNQGVYRGFPMQAFDIFTLNTIMSKYLLFLQESNLPRVIKRHYWGVFIEKYFYQSLINIADKSASVADVERYFERLLKSNHFGIRTDTLSKLNEITRYSGTVKGFFDVEDFHGVPDQGFRYWWGNIGNSYSFFRDINPLSSFEFEDITDLGNGAMDLWDNVYALNLDLIESWELVWNQTYYYKDDLNVLDYHLVLKNALDTYEFMSFNQKVYNFYLDMFGPSFAYLLYHFPGHSVQLNDNNFSYYEKVQWLKEYVYNSNSTLFSNLSLLHRLKTWDFHNYMKSAQSSAKSGELSKDFSLFYCNHNPADGENAIKDLYIYNTYSSWDKSQFASSVIPNLQWYVSYYEPVNYDEERLCDEIFALKDDGGGSIDYGTTQVGESWFNEWDYRRQDIGFSASYRIPFDWFYTSKWVDYENSPVKKFFFNSSTFMFRIYGAVGLEEEHVYKGRFERTVEKIKYKQQFHRHDLDQGVNWDFNIPNLLMQDRSPVRPNEFFDDDHEWSKIYLESFLVTRDVYYTYKIRPASWNKIWDYQNLTSYNYLQFYTSRDYHTVILDDPNINVEQYNQMINERMVEKPLCYNYWIFYEGMDNAASSVSNFENLNVLNENMFYDAPSEWQYGFQDPASPIMEGIIDLHHDLFFFMILVSVFVSWVLFNIIYYFNTTNYNFKIRIQKWVHEEIRETLLDLVNVWYALTIRLVNMASASNNAFINMIAQKFYDITMLCIYWENKYFNKWYHEKELEHLVVNSKLYSDSLLPKNIVDILKYIGQNDYEKVEYFYNEKEQKGYFISKNNVELYNKFKNDPNNTCYSSRVGTVLNNLVSVRDLQLQLSGLYFTDMVKEKEHINKVISDNILEYENFEEDFEEYQLKEEFVWFPQLFVHNTTIEVIWTIIPAVILIFIAVPSFSLLYAMDQIWQPLFTIKVLGNQWYWSYEYC